MVTGNMHGSGYKLKIIVDIYGPPASRAQLTPHLAWIGEISTTGLPPEPYERQTGVTGTSSSPKKGKGRAVLQETEQEKESRRIMESLKELQSSEGRNDNIMESLTKGFDVLKLPMHPDPPSRKSGQLKHDLLVRQSIYPYPAQWNS